ncbi:MAG: ABC transporter ATP-binding protein [Patescibacteria group bacterium]
MSVIEVNNLKKHFGKVKAVDGISFKVEKGEIFGFLGPNGAGKTTTIRVMMDFIRPTEGDVKILGKDAQKNTVELKKNIGFLSGSVNLYKKLSGQAHIDFLKKLNGEKDIADELAKRFDFNPEMKSKKLSSGNKQKLGIILAFMNEPNILILDEPTNALDPLLQNEMYELMEEARDRGATVFMSSHNLAEVERVCDRVGIIKKGKMVAIEDMVGLKEKKIYTIKAFFGEEIDEKEFNLNGVQIDRHHYNNYTLKVKGDIDEIVKKVSKYKLRDIEIAQASLEDIFLEYYE